MLSSTRDTSRQWAPVHLRYGWTPNPPSRHWPDSSVRTMGPSRASSVWTSSSPSRSRRASRRTAGSADESSQLTASPVLSSIVLRRRSWRRVVPRSPARGRRCRASARWLSQAGPRGSRPLLFGEGGGHPFPPVADRGQLRSHSGEPGLARDRRGLTKEAGVQVAEDVDGLGEGGGGGG